MLHQLSELMALHFYCLYRLYTNIKIYYFDYYSLKKYMINE